MSQRQGESLLGVLLLLFLVRLKRNQLEQSFLLGQVRTRFAFVCPCLKFYIQFFSTVYEESYEEKRFKSKVSAKGEEWSGLNTLSLYCDSNQHQSLSAAAGESSKVAKGVLAARELVGL